MLIVSGFYTDLHTFWSNQQHSHDPFIDGITLTKKGTTSNQGFLKTTWPRVTWDDPPGTGCKVNTGAVL